jgi:acetylornithine/N-succinyldiaminopimelate aminotransferase
MTNASTSHLMSTYANLPISLDRGEGVWLWDEDGRKYLDGLAGIAVNTLGHNHKRLVAAITDQVTRIIHSSNIYRVKNQELLADQLVQLSHMDKVFFCNSGLEANEAAIKIARKYGHDKGIDLPQIIVYDNAFHGRSLATLSATGNVKVQKGFGPLVEGFVRVPPLSTSPPNTPTWWPFSSKQFRAKAASRPHRSSICAPCASAATVTAGCS